MARYLVVAHQTAASKPLLSRAEELAHDDRGATFTLLIPATHPTDLMAWDPNAHFVWNEHQVMVQAQTRAAEAWRAFEHAGLRVESALIGDASPVLAVEDELRDRPEYYDLILLSTLPASRSRWIAQDTVRRIERLGLRVIHVEGNLDHVHSAGEVMHSIAEHIPQPAPVRSLRGVFSTPDTSKGLTLIAIAMGIYLVASAILALTVNRTFFLNDVFALAVFGGLMTWLILSSRARADEDERLGEERLASERVASEPRLRDSRARPSGTGGR